MSNDGRRHLDGRRRTLLKGVGLGALGAVGLGAGVSVGPDLLPAGTKSDHERIRNLVPTGQVTHRATGGRWAATGTWADGSTPDADARVHVPAETTVTLDHREDARLLTVRVDGTLRVDPATDSGLVLDSLVVTDTGRLEIGTADAPVGPEGSAEITFADRGDIDESRDPGRLSRGLLVLDGASVSIHGAPKTGWDALAAGPRAGDGELQLAEPPSGWETDDRLVVAGLHPAENRDEEVTVANVADDRVAIRESLTHDHVPPREDLAAYVANLDRTVRFRSESTVPRRRGHIMFMTEDVTVHNAGFYDLGRTEKARPFTDPANGTPPSDAPPNPQARYSCHFHRTGVDRTRPPREVSGCVAWGSPGWGFVNHHSYVEFVDNVAYEVFGAGFVAEIGTEVGSFEGNFALRGRGSGEVPDSRQFRAGEEGRIDDFGHGGHGFWFQGPGCAVEDNVAGGHRHFGFVYWTRAKPDEPVSPDRLDGVVGTVPAFPLENVDGQPDLADVEAAEDGHVPPSFVKFRTFRGNTVFGSGGGLDVSRHRFGGPNDPVDEPSVVEDFTAYNVGAQVTPWDDVRPPNAAGAQGGNNGISIRYSKQLELRDVRLVAGAGDSRGVGINHNHAPVSVSVHGAEIEGWKVGIRARSRGEVPVRTATLSNEIDVQLAGGANDSRWAPQRTRLSDVDFGDGGRADVVLTPELDGDLYGLFSPESEIGLNGASLFHEAQRPEFVPIPTDADLDDLRGDSLVDLTDADPGALVGKTNGELWDEFGLAVDGELVPGGATRTAGVEAGYVTGGTGTGGSGRRQAGIFEHVYSAVGSLFEFGRLAQGESLYVYGDDEFLAVPGRYAGLPYIRPEDDAGSDDRRSFLQVRLTSPATVSVAYDAEASAGWLGDWTDTGSSLGTSDGPRQVYSRETDAGLVTLGPPANTHRMYTVFATAR